jgi:hypothetical protein
MFTCFFNYIKLRQIALTGYVFNYELSKRYDMPKQNDRFVQYLKIYKKNMKGRQLINLLHKYKKLKSLLLNSNEYHYGNSYNDEYHYQRYPRNFRQYILVNFSKMSAVLSHSLKDLQLEHLYICFSGSNAVMLLSDIINASPLKKIILKTSGRGYLPLIFDILKKRQINEIQIYDNTICDKTQFDIVLQILSNIHLNNFVTKLEIHTGDISGGNANFYQTVVILYVGELPSNELPSIKISFVIQYIISYDEMQMIFDHCPNMNILSLIEYYNFEDPEYIYLFDNNIRYPPKLDTIILHDESNEINMLKIINEIKTIKKIYISFYIYEDKNDLPPFFTQLMEAHPHIEFIRIMG